MLLSLFLTVYPIPSNWFGLKDISTEFVYVVLGMSLSEKIVDSRDKLCKWYMAVIAGIAAAVLYFSGEIRIGYKVSSILMIYVMLTLAVMLSKYEKGILKYIGKHAFTVYIYSWPVQAVIELILTVGLGISWYVIFFCMFFGGLVGPLLIYEGYTRAFPKNKFLDVMIGV